MSGSRPNAPEMWLQQLLSFIKAEYKSIYLLRQNVESISEGLSNHTKAADTFNFVSTFIALLLTSGFSKKNVNGLKNI